MKGKIEFLSFSFSDAMLTYYLVLLNSCTYTDATYSMFKDWLVRYNHLKELFRTLQGQEKDNVSKNCDTEGDTLCKFVAC